MAEWPTLPTVRLLSSLMVFGYLYLSGSVSLAHHLADTQWQRLPPFEPSPPPPSSCACILMAADSEVLAGIWIWSALIRLPRVSIVVSASRLTYARIYATLCTGLVAQRSSRPCRAPLKLCLICRSGVTTLFFWTRVWCVLVAGRVISFCLCLGNWYDQNITYFI